MCKAHIKVTHIKQQIYFHHLKRPGYNTEFLLYPRPFSFNFDLIAVIVMSFWVYSYYGNMTSYRFFEITSGFVRSQFVNKPNFVDLSGRHI